MASKRKSTTPCMIPSKSTCLREELEQEAPSLPRPPRNSSVGRLSPPDLGESSRPEGGDTAKDGGGTYTCRPCNFETHDLNLFLDHVYSGHPEFRSDPSFLCVDCGVSAAKFEGLALHNARVHPSTITTTLQLRRRERRAIVEQSLVLGAEQGRDAEISITKTPIMRMLKGKSESKRIVVSHSGSDEPVADPHAGTTSREPERKDIPTVTVTHVPTIVHNGGATKVTLPSAIQIVNGSGALPMLKTAMTQVVSVVQNRNVHQSTPITVSSASTSSSASSKNLPKVMIPLSSIPTYSASMDSSSFLKTSFSKFPYPTKAELCYLTVVTKFPEEQIKIWFTAQRLKQGISWSPEEIEDARRKMFNTIIQTAPPSSQHQRQSQGHHNPAQHTITVLPASLGATGIPHILQGSLMGQGGVIVTQPMMANGIQVSSTPMALAVTPKPQAAARPMMQARPAAALVADKGISMVLGTVGSSSGGSNILSSSSGGRSTSSVLTSSSISSSRLSGHATVINLSLGSSGYSNTNGKVISVNGKLSNANANVNGKSNTSATSIASLAKSGCDGKNSPKPSATSSPAKSTSESKVSADIKSNTDTKTNCKNVSNGQKGKDLNVSDKSGSASSTGTTSATLGTAAPPVATTTTMTPTPSHSPALKTEVSSSPATKCPSPNTSCMPGSRTLPNTFLDPSFYKSKKSQEQLSALKDSFLVNQFPNQEEVDRLISMTGLTVREVRKWFSDRRYHFRNLKGSRSGSGSGTGGGKSGSGAASASGCAGSATSTDPSDGNAAPAESPRTPQQGSAPLSPPPSQTPTSPTTPSRRAPRPPSPDFTAIRYKERDPQQVKALEASFALDPDPPGEEVDRLRGETKMTRREIHGWFAERRKRLAAEKKREEAERAEREEEPLAGGHEARGGDGPRKEEEGDEGREERQREEGSGEPKVNPIKINLKMLKVTEANGKPESEGADSPAMPPPPGAAASPAPAQSPKPAPAQSPKPSPIRGKKTAEQLHLLKQVYARTQWPSAPQYDDLISGTGLPRPEVVRWFGDCRYVQKNGMLKWLEAYQNMALEEDLLKGDTQILRAHLEAHCSLEEAQVLELAQASGLTEELVRRWFSNQSQAALAQGEGTAAATTAESTSQVLPCQNR
ncbi:zinc fingers and homeoboxes protein 3 [Aplochiton taeniatus]